MGDVDDSINTLPGGGQSPNANAGGVLLGQLLGERYRVVGEIGKGGMATVYVAEHMLIGRLVAIKVLHPQFAENAECVRRFLAEGRTAGTLGHPNIVESTDMGFAANGAPFMVLELLEGSNLEDEIRRQGNLPIQRTARIGVQISSALAAAHSKGIIHRDLKSPNIFLIDPGARDHVKVLDFGISKFMEASGQTQRGMLFGTPSFMSPEQVSDPGAVDRRTDVYALGVILYEMLTGRLPFDQVAFPLIFAKILQDEPIAIEKLRSDIPRELAELIRKAMAKSLDARIQSMEELGELLAPFAGPDLPRLAVREGSKKDKKDVGRKITLPSRVPPPARMPTGSDAPPVYGTPPIYAAILDAPPESTPSMELAVVGRARRRLVYAGAAAAATLLLAIGTCAIVGSSDGDSREQASREQASREQASPERPTPAPALTAPVPETVPSPAAALPVPAPAEVPAEPQAEAPAAPSGRVLFVVESPTRGAKMTFRGQTHRLPFSKELTPGREEEVVEIGARGHETERRTVLLDRERRIQVNLESSWSRERARAAPVPAPLPAETGPAPSSAPLPVPVPIDTPPESERPAPPVVSAPEPSSPPAPRAGTMDEAATKKAVRRHLAQLQECVDRGRMDEPQLAGKVWVEINVASTGSVLSARVTRKSTLRNRFVESCIESEIATWTLPQPAGGVETTIHYLFPFP